MSASLPAPQQSSQRQPPTERTSAHLQSSSPTPQSQNRTESSQTLFEDDPTSQAPETKQQSHQETRPTPPKEDDDSIKKCWICFADSTEDTPETSQWRDPCSCALVAHEECLLDWIADTESSNESSSQVISGTKIQCPQCKGEIRVARPKDYVVEAVRGMGRLGSQLLMPGALTVLFGMVYHNSLTWGIHSIYTVFGPEDGFRILEPMLLNRIRPPIDIDAGGLREVGQMVLGTALDHLVHWRLYVGLPLISPLLILSRTRIADSILPVLPIFFFATQNHTPEDHFELGQWPPSASLAFAVLPYIRSAYNAYYRAVWSEREKKWLAQIQQKATQGQNEGGENDAAGDANDAVEGGEEGNVFEIRVDAAGWERWDDDDEAEIQDDEAHVPDMPPVQQPQEGQQEPPNIPNIQDELDAANLPLLRGLPVEERNHFQQQLAAARHRQRQRQQQRAFVNGNRRNNNAAPGEAALRPRRLSFSPTAIAESVLGALIFPTLASLSGELLKLALPRSWTTPPSPATVSHLRHRTPARGLLQEKWGRSLVGGCLFVVLKDAVLLYVKWKMAQMHGQRRVVDYDRGKGKKRDSAGRKG